MRRLPTLLATAIAALCILPIASGDDSLPMDSAYVTVGPDGNLILDGKRIRFWGLTGQFPSGDKEANALAIRRLRELGFNMIRLWKGFGDPEAAEAARTYTKGDGSFADVMDHFLYACGKEGMHVWLAGFGNSVGSAMPEEVGIVDDPETAEAWAEAVGPEGYKLGKNGFATAWDPRLGAIRLQRLKSTADHVNSYTGLRWGDDPTIAVWELVNEDWWFFHMIRGRGLRLPAFFRDALQARWNAWLIEKYGDEDALRAAWFQNILPGESLADGSVALLPLASELNDEAQAISLGVGVQEAVGGPVGRESFVPARGSDVVEFLLSVWIAQKERETEFARGLGKSIALAPLVWDTGIGFNLPTQYMQSRAPAVSHATYMNGTHHPDPSDEWFPWFSALREPPKLAWDNPWLEHNKVEGKPFLVYENNIMQPAKYRGEHPLRMAMLGSINDWDAIITHYWGAPLTPDKQDFNRALDYATAHHNPQGYHFQFDAVLQASLELAGEIFKHQHLQPATNPTRLVFGAKSLFSLDGIEYPRVGDRLAPTSWRHGLRIEIDPSREDDAVEGPLVRRAIYEASPVQPTPEMRADWHRGHLVFDAPGAAVFCGFFGRAGGAVDFEASGLRLESVEVENDPDLPYPVAPDEGYITFGVVSRDGLPLEQTRDALLVLQSTSFNRGFELVPDALEGVAWHMGAAFYGEAGSGGPDVLYARPAAKIHAPALRGMTLVVRDWNLREIHRQTVDSDVLEIPASWNQYRIDLAR